MEAGGTTVVASAVLMFGALIRRDGRQEVAENVETTEVLAAMGAGELAELRRIGHSPPE